MINIKNLKRARDYIAEHVDADKIDMKIFRRRDDRKNPICGSVGCIVGHTTALDIENIQKRLLDSASFIWFPAWSDLFYFGTKFLDEKDGNLWRFLFHGKWDGKNNKAEALSRMDYVIEHKEAPENWDFNWGKG